MAYERRVGDKFRRVPLPPGGLLDGNIGPGDLSHLVYDLPDGISPAVTAVQDVARPSGQKMLQGSQVGVSKVGDVYVVPDTGPVRCGIIGSEDLKTFIFPFGCFEGAGDKVGRVLIGLSQAPPGIGTGDVEISGRCIRNHGRHH